MIRIDPKMQDLVEKLIESGNENEGALRVTWTKPGLIAGAEGNPIGFDGIEYPNSGQSNVDVIDYKVP